MRVKETDSKIEKRTWPFNSHLRAIFAPLSWHHEAVCVCVQMICVSIKFVPDEPYLYKAKYFDTVKWNSQAQSES